jgi:signal transduction histidine kinase
VLTGPVGWAIAALATGMAVALVAIEHDNPGFSVARVVIIAAVGLAMVGAGMAAAVSGEERIGWLSVVAGTSWLLERLLQSVDSQLALSLSGFLPGLWAALLIHAVVAFPTGRLRAPLDRVLVAGFYLFQVGGQVAITLTIPRWEPRGAPGPNEVVLWRNADLADRIGDVTDRATIPVLVVTVVLLVHRIVTASPPARRAYGYVWVGGVLLTANLVLLITAGLGWVAFDSVYGVWLEYAAGLVPVAMAASLLAARVAQDRLVHLVVDLEAGDRGERLRASLRRALDDPGLDLVYRRPGAEGWIDADGHAVDVATVESDTGRVLTSVDHHGEPIGALVHDPVLRRDPDRLATAAAAAGLAIDNERLQAELRSRLAEVEASRARIVEAGDRERRRVERNLHDGAQQRLVGLALTLSLASRKVGDDPEVSRLLADASRDLDEALVELRELAQGIHPAILGDAGLVGAIEVLAQRPGVPVELVAEVSEPLPPALEACAYYVVAEALANVNKHAGATGVVVRASVVDDELHLSVADDGRGGAAARPGSGLEGLVDRVSALSGHLRVDSSPAGTTLTASMPLTPA